METPAVVSSGLAQAEPNERMDPAPVPKPPWFVSFPYGQLWGASVGTLAAGILFRNLSVASTTYPDVFGGQSAETMLKALDFAFWSLGIAIFLSLAVLYAIKTWRAPMVLLWEWRTGRRNLVWMPFMSLAFFLNGTPREVVANVGARWFLIVIWCLAFVWQVVGGIHFYDTWLFGIGPRKDRGRATSSSDTQATNKAGSFGMAILSDMGIASALRTSQAGLPEPKYDLDFTVFFTIINWLVLSNSAFGVLALPRTVASLCLYLGLPLTFLAYLVAFSSMKALPPAKAYNSPTVFLLMAPFGAGAVARANLAGHLVDDPLAESLMWSSCFAYLFAIYAIGGPLQIWKILQGFGGWTLCFPTATNAVSVMRYMLESGAAANATRGVVGVLAGTSAILTIWMVFMSIRLGFSKKLVDVEFVKAWEEGAHEWALDARGRRHRGQNGSTNGN